MRLPHGVGVTCSTIPVIAFLCSAPAIACNGNVGTSLTSAFQRNQSLPNFTFVLDVAMAMRHFPWLHFHMEGEGKYEAGKAYSVHFTKLPWFAPRPQHDADLTMLDPAMWPTRYSYQQAGEADGNLLYDLHSLYDPTLTKAVVSIGPKWCAREVQTAYSDGSQIKMDVQYGMVDGFTLPATLTAQVDVPHMALAAQGQFKDYRFESPSVPGIPGISGF